MDNGASSYRRFLDGDESAFNEIMEELFRSLVFFINGYVHDIHAAEDIAIDALPAWSCVTRIVFSSPFASRIGISVFSFF